jgi:hypothetical protein
MNVIPACAGMTSRNRAKDINDILNNISGTQQ